MTLILKSNPTREQTSSISLLNSVICPNPTFAPFNVAEWFAYKVLIPLTPGKIILAPPPKPAEICGMTPPTEILRSDSW